MPILGLTDRGAAFPRIGTLRKGAPKPNEKQPGTDLKDCFRLETDDADVAKMFQRAYGPRPNHIRVMLPYATVAENFDTWQEHWTAGALQHRCDGRTCVRTLQPDGTYSARPIPCPGKCKPAGRLVVWVPELGRAGVILIPTTSIHDIVELQANLEAAQALRGDLRGIPFVLSRRPRKISTPGSDGKRRRLEKWLLSIEPAPEWVRLQLAATARAALPNSELKQLPAPADHDDEPEEDCEALRDELRQLRSAWKASGGEPWPLTRNQVLAMSCAELRREVEATRAAIEAQPVDADEMTEPESEPEPAGSFEEDYDAIEAAQAAA